MNQDQEHLRLLSLYSIRGLCLLMLVVTATAHAGETNLRLALGDRVAGVDWPIPAQLLNARDLVCIPADPGRDTNNPQIRISKFMDTSKMTPAELAKRKREGFNWICYDNENGETWPTPKAELADPTKYTILAAKLTHAAGLKFIAEPNFELITGRGSHGMNGRLELTDKHVPFVRLKEAAPYLDAISLQLQRAQTDVEKYRDLTRQYAAEVRSANSNAIIFVQVTTREKSGRQPTPADLMDAVRNTAGFVDGIWIHIDKGQENFARELVTLMTKAGYR